MATNIRGLHIDSAVAEIRLGEDESCLTDVARAAGELADRADVHVVLLTGARDAFAIASEAHTAMTSGTTASSMSDAASMVEQLPQPVVACVEGAAAGAGLALALACDLRIAAEDATFSVHDVAAGHVPAMGVTQRLPRLIGRGRASAMILLCEIFDAQSALECGLLNLVVAGGATADRGRAMAERIATQGPIAMRFAKESIRQGLDMTLEQALRYETDLTIILQSTDDRAEGVRAFLEKRTPTFNGS